MLGPLCNLLWLCWVLPAINEVGSAQEVAQWLLIQLFITAVFFMFIAANKKIILWGVLAYAIFVLMHTLGVLGWGLMGAATPLSIFAVTALLFLMAFGLIYHALKDLNLGGKTYRSYYLED